MKYVLLIHDDEKLWNDMPAAERDATMAEYFAFTRAIRESGHYVAGEALQPVATATSVRLRGGQLQTTDGPFAETREQLGGFYMVNAASLDEAVAIAARIPSARLGTIEVRPVVDFSGADASRPAAPAAATAGV
jgi:hypothetical protein